MIRAFQWDLARQKERLEWLIGQLPRYADWGYQQVYLHLEDAVHYPSLPGVARRDAYSQRQFGKLVDAAGKAGIGVVPIVNLLGHTQYLIKVPELRDLNELRAPDGSALPRGQVCPLHPRLPEIAGRLIGDIAPFCTAGRVHVGLDESFHLGRHPLSRAEIAEVGLEGHFARHVHRLNGIAAAHRLGIGMWADMLALLPKTIPLLPGGIAAYDWYYYPFPRSPRIELHNFAEYDLAPALRSQGIEYWGCPMNGAFRFEPMPVFGDRVANIRDWWRRCGEVGAAGMLVTSWEANRLAAPLPTVVDAAAADLWLSPDPVEPLQMLTNGFRRALGGAAGGRTAQAAVAAQAARAALAADDRAFSGYARWEINDRWDVCAGREGTARARRECAFFDRWLGRFDRVGGQPEALVSSFRFRRYLARRDLFVREAAAAVLRLRRHLPRAEDAEGGSPAARAVSAARAGRAIGAGRARGAKRSEPVDLGKPPASNIRHSRELALLARLAAEFETEIRPGRSAARAMWSFTRDRRDSGPNALITDRDATRLRALERWIAQAQRDPSASMAASPVCGAWQARFFVHLAEPALQKVLLEEQQPDGTWQVLHARFTIEFRPHAARPRASIRREFSAPVHGPGRPLRIALRGLGRVGISGVEITDGTRTLRARIPSGERRRTLGRQAPSRGFPVLDWERNAEQIELKFG